MGQIQRFYNAIAKLAPQSEKEIVLDAHGPYQRPQLTMYNVRGGHDGGNWARRGDLGINFANARNRGEDSSRQFVLLVCIPGRIDTRNNNIPWGLRGVGGFSRGIAIERGDGKAQKKM